MNHFLLLSILDIVSCSEQPRNGRDHLWDIRKDGFSFFGKDETFGLEQDLIDMRSRLLPENEPGKPFVQSHFDDPVLDTESLLPLHSKIEKIVKNTKVYAEHDVKVVKTNIRTSQIGYLIHKDSEAQGELDFVKVYVPVLPQCEVPLALYPRIFEQYSGSNWQRKSLQNEKWTYFPDMVPGEVIIFFHRKVFHCAFKKWRSTRIYGVDGFLSSFANAKKQINMRKMKTTISNAKKALKILKTTKKTSSNELNKNESKGFLKQVLKFSRLFNKRRHIRCTREFDVTF